MFIYMIFIGVRLSIKGRFLGGGGCGIYFIENSTIPQYSSNNMQ